MRIIESGTLTVSFTASSKYNPVSMLKRLDFMGWVRRDGTRCTIHVIHISHPTSFFALDDKVPETAEKIVGFLTNRYMKEDLVVLEKNLTGHDRVMLASL